MFETNVLGTVRMTQALLPLLEAAPESARLSIAGLARAEALHGAVEV